VKFNLKEKKAAPTVRLCPVEVALIARNYAIVTVEGPESQIKTVTSFFPLHSPPDRLALYHCYLI
jgi:hypothetical protein